jgi:hypothetical protein
MTKTIEDLTVDFFKNLKCDLSREGEILIVKNVPKSFEDLFGKSSPYKISFISKPNCEFAGKGSLMLSAITKYLDNSGKTTLLKIDFDIDLKSEVERAIDFKNCKIGQIEKRNKNNFFSRFTFSTKFNYMNKTEQIINEIYVHENKVVNGDLSGYTVLEGEESSVSNKDVKEDYDIAREKLKELLEKKKEDVKENLEKNIEIEIERISEHYNSLIKELGLDLNDQLQKISETENKLKFSKEDDSDNLEKRLVKLKQNLMKLGTDDAKSRILKEKEFTIKDAYQKHSLNVENKLLNTTLIYYPIFKFDLVLEDGDSKKRVEMTYNPLVKKLSKLHCETCGEELSKINLCSSGHLTCDKCISRCSECGKIFCEKCLKRTCSICGKPLCKDCAVMCHRCGKHTCKDHMRTDCVTGEERCTSCLRACMRCHGMTEEEYFGIALDGSKVCQKCLAKEKQNKFLKKIFKD